MNTTTRTLTVVFLLAVAAVGVESSWAAAPPVWINYQGVLRDAADNPLDGTHDMVFRFYSGLDEEILIDRHTTAQGGAVTVSGGLFNVALGTGSTADGSGPGTYGSLVEVFRDYNEVHLEVQIGADGAPGTEVLTPRTRVISAPYALNASNLAGLPATSLLRSNESDAYTFGTLSFSPGTTLDLGGTVTKATTDHVANFNADLLDNMDSSAFAASAHGHTGAEIVGPVGEAGNADTLDGLDSTYFLNTSAATQVKAGPLIVNSDGVPGSTALQAVGEDIGGSFSILNGTGWAVVGYLDEGISAHGTVQGGYFEDDDSTGQAHVAYGDRGIEASGSDLGGHFSDIDGTSEAYLAHGDFGIRAIGDYSGGYFWASDFSGYAYVGAVGAGIAAHGSTAGGLFEDVEDSGYARVAFGDLGILGRGNEAGGYFQDWDSSGRAYAAYGDRGIEASGSEAGGYFEDSDGTGYAYVGYGNRGVWGLGSTAGGHFADSDGTGYANVGHGDEGIEARGNLRGGYFADLNDSGYANVGHGDRGISSYGSDAGGYFQDSDSSGYALVGYGDRGIEAKGNFRGGYFADLDDSGYASVGAGNFGIASYGSAAGGSFHDSDSSGYAFVGISDSGIEAHGSLQGGYFADTDNSGYARVGYGDRGISANGAIAGGYFGDSDNTGYAYVGYGDSGIEAFGDWTGGYFEDTNNTAHAHVAVGNIGVDARGSQGGGYFADTDSGAWSYVGYDTYKVWGVGSVAFVQNHPYEPDKVIAYNAPEGDEVATYTRGTARLQNGEARVTLGETFTWVTNPDLGLTAHVTPRSADAVVYVESVSTKELVVRNVTGFPGDAVFDYLVYGLRIGFEEKSVVQPKKLESYIPSMAGDRTLYEQAPGLRPYNAFERFKGMREVVFLDEVGPLDLTASHALRDAIHEYDPASDPPLGDLAGHGLGRRKDRPARPESSEPESPVVPETDPDSDSVPAVVSIPSPSPGEEPRGDAEMSPAYPTFPVSEPVEVGDLMVLDPERPGRLRRCLSAADVNVIGIVVGDPATSDGDLQVPVALSDLAVVKADAGYGEIRPGDLLTSSFTPGHAMRAGEIVPGTIIGKALEPLDTGTGLIKVLVMPR